jgi:hypothetical protein
MNRVYSVAEDRTTSAFTPVQCKNEELELQNLLHKNLDLIPGDQIDPENPRRWLLVKREMIVEDPGTAEARWSLDFLIVDQDGIPTLIECKRFRDTRARREVIGQMFDYAANASFYLSRDTLLQYLEERARERGIYIDALVASVEPSGSVSLEGFLEMIENNINQGQLRLVFFMEQSCPERRSIVAFLNNQMERTEVCLVEAKQFQNGDVRVVVPTLWGYTEQARRVKKTVTVQNSGARRVWNVESFREDVLRRLDPTAAGQVLGFYEFCKKLPNAELKWGSGKDRGSFSLAHRSTSQRSLVTVLSDGELWLNFNWLNQTESARRLRDSLLRHLSSIPLLAVNDQNTDERRVFALDRWIPVRNEVERAIQATFAAIGERSN